MSVRTDIVTRKIIGSGLPMAGKSVEGAEHVSAGPTTRFEPNKELVEMIKEDVKGAFVPSLKKSITR